MSAFFIHGICCILFFLCVILVHFIFLLVNWYSSWNMLRVDVLRTCCVPIFVHETSYMLIFLFFKLVCWFFSLWNWFCSRNFLRADCCSRNLLPADFSFCGTCALIWSTWNWFYLLNLLRFDFCSLKLIAYWFLFVKNFTSSFSLRETWILTFLRLAKLILFTELVPGWFLFVELFACWCLFKKLFTRWFLSSSSLKIYFSPLENDFVHGSCCVDWYWWNLLHADFCLWNFLHFDLSLSETCELFLFLKLILFM